MNSGKLQYDLFCVSWRIMGTPLLMGILNVTPNSFSDGGCYLLKEKAIEKGRSMVREGADLIDIGGESTRPGAESPPVEEEIQRVVPVVEHLAKEFPNQISVDTRRYEVALAAAEGGASIINDVSGGSDIRMAELVKRFKLKIIFMHMQGTPQTMQQYPCYPQGVITEISQFLRLRVRGFEEMGIERESIWVDPGIGFGKTLEHNLEVLRHLSQFVNIGGRLVVGTSRKSFLARVLGDPDLGFPERDPGTLASSLWSYACGASVLRVHDVTAIKRALQTWRSIAG